MSAEHEPHFVRSLNDKLPALPARDITGIVPKIEFGKIPTRMAVADLVANPMNSPLLDAEVAFHGVDRHRLTGPCPSDVLFPLVVHRCVAVNLHRSAELG